jgi:predicted permease
MAIRLAIGAGHRQILRHVAIESLVLGLVGGVAGLLFALWTADVLPMFFPPDQVRLLDARVDFRALAWCLTICTLTTMMFGIAPVVRSWRPAAADVLRREGLNVTESRGGARLRRAFVVVQVALAFVLLTGAGLLMQSLRNALDADLGFGAREGIVVSIDLPPELGAVRNRAFYAEALERVQSLPGIERAALSSVAPLTRANRRTFQPEGYQRRDGEDLELFVNSISPSYFEAMQIPLTAGRIFNDRDTSASRRVVIVNEEFASRYFGGAAVGRLVRDSRNTEFEIVGTVRASAMVDPQSPKTPIVYFPLAQEFQRTLRLVASTRIEAARVLASVVSELKAINGAAAVFRPTTIKGQINEALAGNRLLASLVGACGLLALALATVGLYGVVAFSVAVRTREIGVRIALGASARQLSTLVLREGLGLTMLGAIAGGVVAPVVTTAIGSMLYGVSPFDRQTFFAVPVVLGMTALFAASIPLRRALHIDPIRVLRQE